MAFALLEPHLFATATGLMKTSSVGTDLLRRILDG
jgi:hypothetical protein